MQDRERLIASYRLTERETEILELLGKGYNCPGACREMGVSKNRFDVLMADIRKKTGITQVKMLEQLGLWMALDARPEFEEDESKPAVWTCLAQPEGCGRSKAIGEFPNWPIDFRCNDCIETRVEDWKTRKRREQAELLAKEASKALRDKQIDLPHINQAFSELLEKYGGYQAFIKRYYDDLEEARGKSPGSKYVVDSGRDILRMWMEISKQADANDAIESMNMEQAEEYLVELMFSELGKKSRDKLISLYMEEDDGKTGESTAAAAG